MFGAIFCYGDEENGHRACTSEHLTTANQSEIRRAYLFSAWKEVQKMSDLIELKLVTEGEA